MVSGGELVAGVEGVLRVGGTTVPKPHVPHWRWEYACNRFAEAYFDAGFTYFLFGQGVCDGRRCVWEAALGALFRLFPFLDKRMW